MRRTLAVGSLLALAYVAVSTATGLSGREVRPLFEGFAPPAAYQWVAPPARFAAGNQKPSVAAGQIAVAGGKSNQGAVATDDGQFVVNLPPGAVNATAASAIKARITPLDPSTLGPLPAGQFPDGNAYHLELTLDPAGQAVTSFGVPGNLILQLPAAGHTVLFSTDGKAWEDLQAKQATAGSTTMGAVIKSPGFFVGVATTDVNGPPSAAKPGKSSGSSKGTVVLAVVVVLLVLAILLGPVLYRRLRRRRPAPVRAGTRASTRRPPPKKKGSTKRRR